MKTVKAIAVICTLVIGMSACTTFYFDNLDRCTEDQNDIENCDTKYKDWELECR